MYMWRLADDYTYARAIKITDNALVKSVRYGILINHAIGSYEII